MFNPLSKMTVAMLEAFVRKDVFYLVSQSYSRGVQPGEDTARIPLLLTMYKDVDLAGIHYEAIRNDKYRSILHLKHPLHYNRLQVLLSPDSYYNVFVNIIRDKAQMDRSLNELYSQTLQEYIRHHTSLDVKNPGALRTEIDLVYGKWQVQIKYSKQQIQVALDELERITGRGG